MLEYVVNHLWQSTLVVVLAAMLCRMCRRNGAHVRYWLWFIASAKFLVPFSLIGLVSQLLSSRVPPVEIPSGVIETATRLAQPVMLDDSYGISDAMIVGVWAIGFTVVVSRWILHAFRSNRALGKGSDGGPGEIENACGIPIRCSSAVSEPAIVGVVNPVLVFPPLARAVLTKSQFDAVIEHELSHVRRADNLTAIIHMVVTALFWFFPVVWWLGLKLVEERERACDEAVVAAGHDRETYAEAIVTICEQMVRSRLMCHPGVSGGDLVQRITRIMRSRKMISLGRSKMAMFAVIVAVLICAPILGGSWVQGAQPEERTHPQLVSSVVPKYPERAYIRKISGYVDVEFAVTERGDVTDVKIVHASSVLFERSAVQAVQQFKYLPRIENGIPATTPGVRLRISFDFDSYAAAQGENSDH